MSRRRVALAAALITFAAAPAAHAQPVAIGSPAWDAAIGTATSHWGAAPCGGAVGYGYAALPSGVIANASWLRPSSAPSDPARFSDCRVDVDPAADLDPALLCTTLAHELGHLLGHNHVDDPNDLMSPTLGDPLPECVAAMAPFATQRPVKKSTPRRKAVKRPRLRSNRVSH